jgi:hypothetical protein
MIVPVLPIEFHMIQPVMHLFLAHLTTTSLNAMFGPLCYFFLAPPLLPNLLPLPITRSWSNTELDKQVSTLHLVC